MVQTKKKEQGNTLVSGAISLTVSVIIVKIIGFIYKVPLSHILSDEGMGYFNSAYSIFTFFYMLCLGGVPRAVSINIAEAAAKGERENAEQILKVSLKIFTAIGLLFSCALMIFSGFFASLIGNSLARFSLFAIAPSLTFVAMAGVLRGYLNGSGRMIPIAVSEVLDGSIKFIFGLTFALLAARRKMSYPMISAFTVLGVTLGSFSGVLFLYITSKIKNNNENSRQKCETSERVREILRRIFKISIPITLSSAVMGISNIIDLGMIMKRLSAMGYSDTEAVALYGNFTTLALPLLNAVVSLTTPVSTSAMPHLTTNRALKNINEYKKITEGIFTFIGIVVTPIFSAYLLFSNEILRLLFNDESAKLAAPLLSLISPAVIFLPLLTVVNTVLESSSFAKIPLFSMSIGAILKLVSGHVLIGKIGIAGAPVSTVICYAVALIISSCFMLRKTTVSFSVFGVMCIPMLASLISVGGMYALNKYSVETIGKSIVFPLIIIISAAIYILIICIFMRKRIGILKNYVKIAKKRNYSL